MTVYNLIMRDNELNEIFNIGFFSSRERAEEIAQHYLHSVKGFCEYDCGYSVNEKMVVGEFEDSFYIVYGWNGYEDDIVESDCFTSKKMAKQMLEEMKLQFNREEWCVDRYFIDKCKWQDGFVRV